MTTVTVSRNGRSVTMDLYEQGGNLLVARDVGKPEGRLYMTGAEAPTFADHRAPIESYNLVGQLVGPGAYQEARVLSEDIVRAHSGGDAATLDLSNVSGLGSEQVAFIGDRAVALGYPPDQGEWVSVQLTAFVVDNVIGGTAPGPTGTAGTGSGPVEIRRGGTTLSLVKDLDVERTVGRSHTQTRHDADDDPYAVDRPRAYTDEFELSAVWNTNAAANQNTLVEQIVKPPLGFGTLTLDFNGTYGLGEYTVAPVDSNACRVSWSAGEQGMVRLEGLKLMTVEQR